MASAKNTIAVRNELFIGHLTALGVEPVAARAIVLADPLLAEAAPVVAVVTAEHRFFLTLHVAGAGIRAEPLIGIIER